MTTDQPKLPHIYLDRHNDILEVGTLSGRLCIQVRETFNGKTHRATVHAPTGDDAVALARAILAAAEDSAHRVVHEADLVGAQNAVVAMRQRAALIAEHADSPAAAAETILALPLVPDEDDTVAASRTDRYRDRRADTWEDRGNGTLELIAVAPDRAETLGQVLPREMVEQYYGPLASLPTDDAPLPDASAVQAARARADLAYEDAHKVADAVRDLGELIQQQGKEVSALAVGVDERFAELERTTAELREALSAVEDRLSPPTVQAAPASCPSTAFNEVVRIEMRCAGGAGHDGDHHNPADGGWTWGADGTVTHLDRPTGD
ncbi:hypothetical protein [Nocardiopsis sp. NPDC057823]|uniref:hypothetical protein n=1 Tax=Nocardiopsis sp. NPDC057823 TaxID=3346256 RepID=UPI003670B437